MKTKEVLALADRLITPIVGPNNIEEIVVREDDDWSGAPAIYVDVFVKPGARRPAIDVWTRAKLKFSDELVAKDDQRFPYIQVRDRKAEREERPGKAA